MQDISVASTEICNKREESTMRYTKPNVLATLDANLAVQTGGDAPNGKNSLQIQDNMTDPNVRSTTGAYEADE
jgi:hypothetical protein